MLFTFRIALLLMFAALPLAGAEPSADASKIEPDTVGTSNADPSKLVGSWRCKVEERIATYVFRPDGTFSAGLEQAGHTRKFEGRWVLEAGTITYTFASDSEGKMAPATQERDQLLRIDERSYTIQASDGSRRTYWRLK